MAKKVKLPPWKGTCAAKFPNGLSCTGSTPRDWSHCTTHAFRVGTKLDEESKTVTRTLDLPALGKSFAELDSSQWEAIRLRLLRTQPGVTV